MNYSMHICTYPDEVCKVSALDVIVCLDEDLSQLAFTLENDRIVGISPQCL